MEVGWLEYIGASTIGIQPLDWNNAPMTGTKVQPSREPPHTKGKEQAPVTLKNISGEKRQSLGRGGGEENGWKNLYGL